MMSPLFHRAQVDVRVALIGDLKPENVSVECLGRGEVFHIEASMGKPYRVEIRVKIGGGNGHAMSPICL